MAYSSQNEYEQLSLINETDNVDNIDVDNNDEDNNDVDNDIEMSNVNGNQQPNNVIVINDDENKEEKFTICEYISVCIGLIIAIWCFALIFIYSGKTIHRNAIVTGYFISINNELYYDGFIKLKYNFKHYVHTRSQNVYKNIHNNNELANMLRENYPIGSSIEISKSYIDDFIVIGCIFGIVVGFSIFTCTNLQLLIRKDKRLILIRQLHTNEHVHRNMNTSTYPEPLNVDQDSNIVDPA